MWQPAADGVRRVQADLPGLRAQTADVLAMAEEAKRLRAAGGQTVALTPDTRVAAVRRSLERAGLLRDAAAAAETPAAAPVTSLSIGVDSVPRADAYAIAHIDRDAAVQRPGIQPGTIAPAGTQPGTTAAAGGQPVTTAAACAGARRAAFVSACGRASAAPVDATG